jgi:hypothetical protein
MNYSFLNFFITLCVAGLALMVNTHPIRAGELEFDVSGYRDSAYIYGVLDGKEGSKDVDGYLVTEDETELYFEGEWTDEGEIEGFDEEGHYIELSID